MKSTRPKQYQQRGIASLIGLKTTTPLGKRVYQQRYMRMIRQQKRTVPVGRLNFAIKDEKAAVIEYAKLEGQLRREGRIIEANVVGKIRADEAAHRVMLYEILERVKRR